MNGDNMNNNINLWRFSSDNSVIEGVIIAPNIEYAKVKLQHQLNKINESLHAEDFDIWSWADTDETGGIVLF